MAYRRFEDDKGCSWEVWEVHPALVERRLTADRRMATRQGVDRRQQSEVRFPIPHELEQGWLVFQTDNDKRRLAPIPAHWVTLSDADLLILARTAKPYRPTPPGGFRRSPG